MSPTSITRFRVKPWLRLTYLLTCSLFVAHLAQAEEHFLETVPAETSYLAYFELNQENAKLIPKTLPILSEEEAMRGQSDGSKMLNLIMRDLMIHYRDHSLSSLGLPPLSQFTVGVYGLGLWPVLSLTIAKQATFTQWIAKTAKRAGLTPKVEGSALVFHIADSKQPAELVIAFSSPHRVNVSFMPTLFKDKMLPYLTGKQKPAVSMQRAKMFKSWAREAQLSPTNAMFISLERIAKTLLGRGIGVNKAFPWINNQVVDAVPKSCVKEYLEMISHAPLLIMGRDVNQSANQYTGRAVWKFSKTLAEVTKAFMKESAYIIPNEDSLFSFSLNIDLKAIITALQSFIQTRIQTPYTCPHLSAISQPQKLQMFSSQMMMIPPFIFDVSGFSVSVSQLQPTPKGSVIINAKNIINLLNILKSMKPQASQIVIPKAGEGPQKLEGLPNPAPFDIMIELKKDALGLSVGPDHTQKVSTLLSSAPNAAPPLYAIQYNINLIIDSFKKYIQRVKETSKSATQAAYESQVELAKANGSEPPPPPAPEEDSTPEFIQALTDINLGQSTMKMKFTAIGLESSFSIQVNAKP